MKKLVIATALAAMAATAQAQDVKVYGTLDASQYHYNLKNGGNYTGFNSRSTGPSLFGILANEDLGNGLKAGAKVETELLLTDGKIGSETTGVGYGTFNRAAHVFIESKDLGKLTLGRMTAPIYGAAASTGDALGATSFGFINAVVASASNSNKITGETRTHSDGTTGSTAGTYPLVPGLISNGISYTSPKIAGFTVTAFTSPNSGTKDATFSDNGQRDLLVSYNDGDLNVAVGQSKTYMNTGVDFATKNLYAANYTIGALKVTGGYQQTRYDTYHDIDVMSVGAKYQATTKVSVGTSYTTAEDKTTTANKNSTVAVGGFYEFSKRTQAYGLAGYTKNEGAAKMTPVYGATFSPAPGAATQGYAYVVGLKHSF